jgi:TonB-dependent SusC/RagA subfamily outer membrane receptor
MMALPHAAGLVAAWATTSAIVGGVLLLVGLVGQPLAHKALPSRLVWAAGLALTLIVTMGLPLRSTGDAPRATSNTIMSIAEQADQSTATGSWNERAIGATRAAIDGAGTALRTAASWSADRASSAPSVVQWTLVFGWPFASLTLLAVFGLSYRRQARALNHATRVNVHGVPVHVGTVNGPVVFGVMAPRIAVPEWLLSRQSEEQALVVRHEQSHIDAHDPLLLLTACGVAIMLPWNLAVWYMLSRLRLAIELDCDARVLAHGVSPRSYGKLLIDLSAEPSMLGNPAAMSMSATAFSYRASHLERRLRTMTARTTRFLALRRLSVVALGAVATLAACKAELPTSAELQAMDVVKAEQQIGRVVTLDGVSAEYYIDGKRVDRAEATGLTADRIATIDVRKQDGKQQIFVVTGTRASDTSAMKAATGENSLIRLRRTDTSYKVISDRPATPETPRFALGSKKPFEGIIIVNGERSTETALSKLDPSAIESVEIVKGQAAIAQYGTDGANGVIRVLTKK